MAIKNSFCLQKKFKLILLFTALGLVLSGCAGLKTRSGMAGSKVKQGEGAQGSARDDKTPETEIKEKQLGGAGEGVFGEQVPPESHEDNRSEQRMVPKLGVVLGPGSVKAFAHTGVLKQLHKANIPIHSIVGLEWGALVAGLYARNPKVNDVDWRLYKLQAKNFMDSGFFAQRYPQQSISALKPFLKQNFDQSPMSANKLPFSCPSLSIWTGRVIWQRGGSMEDALTRCIPYPPLFEASGPWMAAAFQADQAVEFLRNQGADVILFVDVLGGRDFLPRKTLTAKFQAAILWQELHNQLSKLSGEKLVVVRVNTKGYSLYDFDKRNSLVLAGERAGKEAVDQLIENYGF